MGLGAARSRERLWEEPLQSLPRSGPRYAVVRLPAFRLERCGYAADDVVALVAELRNATRIVAATPAALQEGLRHGMTATEARALLGDVVLEPLDESAEAVDLEALARSLELSCDRVRIRSDDTLVLEISKIAPYHGGEAETLERVRGWLEELGHHCLIALSDHPLASAALASCATEDVLVPAGEGAHALAELPFAALEPSETLLAAVRSLGIRTIGPWALLDPASVAGRFGEEGARLHRVARGALAPPWSELPTPSQLGRLHLPVDHELVTVEEVQRRVQRGLEQLHQALEELEEAVAVLELRLALDAGTPVRVTVRVGRPTRDADLLGELVRERLSRLTLAAPVVGLTLHAVEVVPASRLQEELLGRREATEPLSELVARLTDALGEEAVFQSETCESWRPEAAWGRRGSREPPVVVKDDPVEQQEGHSWAAQLARPSLLRRTPRPVRVRCQPDGHPLALRSPRGWCPVLRARGPERLEGDWWRSDPYERDYWIAELGHVTLWLFSEGSSWYLHGWFD